MSALTIAILLRIVKIGHGRENFAFLVGITVTIRSLNFFCAKYHKRVTEQLELFVSLEDRERIARIKAALERQACVYTTNTLLNFGEPLDMKQVLLDQELLKNEDPEIVGILRLKLAQLLGRI